MELRPDKQYKQIGFNQILRLHWLEYTASLMLEGKTPEEMRGILQNTFQGAVPIRSMLMKIWVCPPHELKPLHQEGLALLADLPREDRLLLHWGMTMAAYPFFRAVATHVGRHIRLYGMVSSPTVVRRIIEEYGERSTVKNAVRCVLRTMTDWGVLQDAVVIGYRRPSGIYAAGPALSVDKPEIFAWLTEAYLYAHNANSVCLDTILNAPSLFPLEIDPAVRCYLNHTSERLEVQRLGGGQQEVVWLR